MYKRFLILIEKEVHAKKLKNAINRLKQVNKYFLMSTPFAILKKSIDFIPFML